MSKFKLSKEILSTFFCEPNANMEYLKKNGNQLSRALICSL